MTTYHYISCITYVKKFTQIIFAYKISRKIWFQNSFISPFHVIKFLKLYIRCYLLHRIIRHHCTRLVMCYLMYIRIICIKNDILWQPIYYIKRYITKIFCIHARFVMVAVCCKTIYFWRKLAIYTIHKFCLL